MSKLINFLEEGSEIDGHSLFDPFRLNETEDFSEQNAEDMILVALDSRIENSRGNKLTTAWNYLHNFNKKGKTYRESIKEFIKQAKKAHKFGNEE